MNTLKMPSFDINPEKIPETLETLLKTSREKIAQLVKTDIPTWDNTIEPLDDLGDKLGQYWASINHLNSVANTPELRKAYNTCLPMLSDYGTDMGQNKDLFNVYRQIRESDDFVQLNPQQQISIDYALRDFRLSGIELNHDDKKRYKQISARLSELTTKFEENILDATHAWNKHIVDEVELAGLPEQRKQAAKETAKNKKLNGWILTLDHPCYHDVMTFADSQDLRKEFYQAFTTRASEQEPNANKFDNAPLMVEILKLRNEKSKLLGFTDYAEYSLNTKMVRNAEQVETFLNNLVEKIKPKAERALQELKNFVDTETLNPWDIAYYSEKLRQREYDINQEKIREYFPAEQVVTGLFSIVEKLYAVTLKQVDVETWNPEVKFYELYDENKQLIGGVYFDLYAREHKRGGAWMDDAVDRRKMNNDEIQLPMAFLTCNFASATTDKPALLTHDDVITIFHEFGHCLQHLLTKMDYPDVSGINNVPWDAVELPSQFFEAWCWQPESLQLLSKHYQTGETLPQEMIDRMIAAKNFQAGLFLIRQLEFALFDITLYSQYSNEKDFVQKTLHKIREQVAVLIPPKYNRFANSFSHIFAGGYAAGYYSYLWAEVLARDAFSVFKKQGIFNRKLGEKFKNTILGQGGSQSPQVLFKEFIGRDVDDDALLDYYGLR